MRVSAVIGIYQLPAKFFQFQSKIVNANKAELHAIYLCLFAKMQGLKAQLQN